jgi:hypothetical protein
MELLKGDVGAREARLQVKVRDSYWIRVARNDTFGTMPSSTSSWPLRGLPVLSHRS